MQPLALMTGQVLFAKNTASSTAGGGRDDTLDRSYDHDQVGRLIVAHTGYEARLHMNRQQAGDPVTYGSYSQSYAYDPWGNLTSRAGWGGEHASYTASFDAGNRRTNFTYDASGNLTSDGGQTFQYDAAGRQVSATAGALQMAYDGDGLRVRKVDDGATTYYLRSSLLGRQVVGEINSSGVWTRGYVYLGSQMLAIQQGNSVQWVHQDPVTKSQRVTDGNGNVVSTIDLDPWGGETTKSSNQTFQPHRFTTYERDAGRSDDALARRYNRWHSRFDQPDPYRGSYDLADPQSFNRYSYVQNDPVNFVDPTGLRLGLIYDLLTVNETVDVIGFINDLTGGGATSGPDMPVIDHSEKFEPQNPAQPAPDVSGIRSELERMLSNLDCANFIKDLLGRVASEKNPLVSGGNILEVYDEINSPRQGGMIRAGAPGSVPGANFALGSIATNDARIQIGATLTGPPTARGDAPIARHETIHHAGRYGYTDQQLSEAVSAMTGRSIRFPNGDPLTGDSRKDSLAYSEFWDAELNRHCR